MSVEFTMTTAEGTGSSETNAALIYIPVCVFLAACPLVVGTRIWSRMGMGSKLGADDYTILISLAFALGSGAIMLVGCQYGYGQHAMSLSAADRYEAFKYFYMCQITYKASINFTKASILLLYLRIFSGVKWFKWTCRFVLACVAMYCLSSVTVTVFQCDPIAGAFDKTIKSKCIDNGHFWYANAGFSIATDIVILVIPMPLVYALQIPRVQKVALIMVFALGVFVLITSCLRITTIDIQATSMDPLYDISSTMWTIIKMNVAIICACLPQIRPLVVKLFPRLMPAHYPSRERSDKRTIRSSYSKSYSSYQPNLDGCIWSHSDGREGLNLTAIRKGDTSSEEYILQEDRSLQIQKTVQYSVEYSKDGITPCV